MDSPYAALIDEKYCYDGFLGIGFSEYNTDFAVWAPEAEKVVLCLYKLNASNTPFLTAAFKKSPDGVFRYTHPEPLSGIYYTYRYTYGGVTSEGVDPYAKAVGANGEKGFILDPSSVCPYGWENDRLGGIKLENYTDAVLYELSIRDFSMDDSSGIEPKLRGKYRAFTVNDTINPLGEPTCLSHLKRLGITHVHLMPTFDFDRLDEEHLESDYNWGYDPKNYNVPEGSYSTDPNDPSLRIKEFKEMVMSLHRAGLGVVMDVVYNHTFKGIGSNLWKAYPEYYYRQRDGKLTNGSGCGNELASERAMVRRYIVDSVLYWAKEYKIDGFRFDLMACIDTDTMNEIADKLKAINPNAILYGEGWAGGDSALDPKKASTKQNSYLTPQVAYFNDNYRDVIKGATFVASSPGYLSGNFHLKQAALDGLLGKQDWACDPESIVNYCEAHDNYTLWDKLALSCGAHENDRKKMSRLAAVLVILAQGIPFIHAGQEFLRSKPLPNGGFDHNSYRSPDSVNSLKWQKLSENIPTFNYYKGLIAFRKAHRLFRMTLRTDVLTHSEALPSPDGTVSVRLFDEDEEILILINPIPRSKLFALPDGEWQLHVTDITVSQSPLATYCEGVFVPPISAMVLVKPKK